MMYLWPQAGSMYHMPESFGCITTAAHGSVPRGIRQGRLWALDNECFSRPFCFDRWQKHWLRLAYYSKRCLFVFVPDNRFRLWRRSRSGKNGTAGYAAS